MDFLRVIILRDLWKIFLFVEPWGLFTYQLFHNFKQWLAMRGHIFDCFRVEWTVFRWACTSGGGFEDEGNFARESAMSFPGIALCPGTRKNTTSCPSV